MKKLISLLLCLSLALSCATACFAEATESAVQNMKDMGMNIKEPEEFSNLEGVGFFNPQGVVTHDPFFSLLVVGYYAFPQARLKELRGNASDATEAEAMGLAQLQVPVLAVIVTTDVDQAISMFLNADQLKPVEFAQKDEFHYCYFAYPDSYLSEPYGQLAAQYPDTYPAEDLEKWLAEAEKVREAAIRAAESAEIFAPVDPFAGAIGQVLEFETTDLDGNTVKSGDLFSGNRITMINVWGTWCHNCIDEMKQLGDLHRKLQEKGCGILGLEYEGGVPAEQYREEALAVLKEYGCDYPNVVIPEGHALLKSIVPGYPTSIFVDSEGRILTFPIVGAEPSRYEPTIEKLLSGEGTEPAAEDAADSGASAYRVFVLKGDEPVEGVTLQFCSADSCFLGTTDAAGMAEFRQPQGEYTIHVLKAPDGYAPAQEEYTTAPVYGDITITLQPAA